mmetsp:Transcript_24612/g.56802  ORF Transcript_24612/g.56802 Transcript_24612/m.56802 type:complete len:102 (+) Transcript_24612:37-342(+)
MPQKWNKWAFSLLVTALNSWWVKGPALFIMANIFVPLWIFRQMKDWMNYTMNIVYDYSARDETWERGAIGMATFFACFTAWCLYEDIFKRKPKKDKEPWQK